MRAPLNGPEEEDRVPQYVAMCVLNFAVKATTLLRTLFLCAYLRKIYHVFHARKAFPNIV